MCGEGAVTDPKCQKWFAKFRAGGFSLADGARRSGRPGGVGSDPKETLIETSRRCAVQEITDMLQVSKSVVTGEDDKCV